MNTAVHVGVLGGSGFVGAAVVEALVKRGASVTAIRSPRLRSGARDLEGLRAELHDPAVAQELANLKRDLSGCSVVINAAGVAAAAAGMHGALTGANALLPGVVAAATPRSARLIHVSSAAVQGRREALDESWETEPFSPYSTAKQLGEALVRERGGDTICFRPTSVHGPGRAVTRTLARVLRSPMASVAGAGDRPTPQVLIGNVADAIAYIGMTPEEAPAVVLQPWERLTTAGLVRLIGGREPLHLPIGVARATVAAGFRAGDWSAGAAGVARRLEMMWFGQRQEPGWLDARWSPQHDAEAWKELA